MFWPSEMAPSLRDGVVEVLGASCFCLTTSGVLCEHIVSEVKMIEDLMDETASVGDNTAAAASRVEPPDQSASSRAEPWLASLSARLRMLRL